MPLTQRFTLDLQDDNTLVGQVDLGMFGSFPLKGEPLP